MNHSKFRVINLLKAREKWRVQCTIKRNNREIILAKNGQLNLVLVLVLEPKGPSFKLVWRQIFVSLPTDAAHGFFANVTFHADILVVSLENVPLRLKQKIN